MNPNSARKFSCGLWTTAHWLFCRLTRIVLFAALSLPVASAAGHRVEDAHGTPLAGAEVVLVTPGQQAEFANGVFRGHVHASKGTKLAGLSTKTNAEGRFSLPLQEGAWVIVVSHESGYLELTGAELHALSVVTPQPWGQVKGDLRMGGIRGTRVPIGLEATSCYDREGLRTHISHPDGMSVRHDARTVTDTQGSFLFDKVPPGDVYLNRWFDVDRGSVALFALLSSIKVVAGQTARVTLGGAGRPVIGRVEGSTDSGLGVDWSNVRARMRLRAPAIGSRLRQKHSDVYGDFLKSEEGRLYKRDNIKVHADGSFRIEDVASGSYSFQIFSAGPTRPDGSSGSILLLNHRFAVPVMPGGRTGEPLDLGMLKSRTRKL